MMEKERVQNKPKLGLGRKGGNAEEWFILHTHTKKKISSVSRGPTVFQKLPHGTCPLHFMHE